MTAARRRVAAWLLAALGLGSACSSGSAGEGVTPLPAAEFSARLGGSAGAQLLDVRTPGEFAKGHLPRALNVDWSGRDFDRRVGELDRSRPVFVYCLSGSRSVEAARRLVATGFREVYDLDGGILKWRAAGLPQVAADAAATGMTRAEFDRQVGGAIPVLVDFYAEWCIPCRQMKPALEQLAAERGARLRVVRIDADDNQGLLRELRIDRLPALALYRAGAVVWSKTGFTSKEEMVSRLEAAR